MMSTRALRHAVDLHQERCRRIGEDVAKNMKLTCLDYGLAEHDDGAGMHFLGALIFGTPAGRDS